MDWDLCETGPQDAEKRVLLLPGGLNSARSYIDVMAQPSLSDLRLIAATLPGHCGTAEPDDTSIENYARLATELAKEHRCGIVVGFSMGATVVLEMLVSGQFTGPAVLLGISLSDRDEPAFIHAIVRLGYVLGSLPSAGLLRLSATMLKSLPLSADRKAQVADDLQRNDPKVVQRLLRDYLRYLKQNVEPAKRLCAAGVPTWVVHTEKGDGGLTLDERRTLGTCSEVTVITLPGKSFLLPAERPQQIAEIILLACGQGRLQDAKAVP